MGGNIEFEDVHVTFEEFGKKKAEGAYTFGALPVLELEDGSHITQSTAILRWVGKQGGLYPQDDLLAALQVDEVMDAIEDIYNAVGPTMRIQDQEEQLAQRNGDNGHFVGSSTTVADLKAASVLDWLTSGMLGGIPSSVVEAHPNLVKIFDTNKASPQ